MDTRKETIQVLPSPKKTITAEIDGQLKKCYQKAESFAVDTFKFNMSLMEHMDGVDYHPVPKAKTLTLPWTTTPACFIFPAGLAGLAGLAEVAVALPGTRLASGLARLINNNTFSVQRSVEKVKKSCSFSYKKNKVFIFSKKDNPQEIQPPEVQPKPSFNP